MQYWEKAGAANTDATVKLAVETALDRNIPFIVVASNTGETLKKVTETLGGALHHGVEMVGVTHQAGFTEPGQDEMPREQREAFKQLGIPLLTTTHLLAGVDRAVRLKFGGLYPAELIASTLRMLGQGVKVSTEIAVMALDAGLIPHGREIICKPRE